jgi:hypothetical protein
VERCAIAVADAQHTPNHHLEPVLGGRAARDLDRCWRRSWLVPPPEAGYRTCQAVALVDASLLISSRWCPGGGFLASRAVQSGSSVVSPSIIPSPQARPHPTADQTASPG